MVLPRKKKTSSALPSQAHQLAAAAMRYEKRVMAIKLCVISVVAAFVLVVLPISLRAPSSSSSSAANGGGGLRDNSVLESFHQNQPGSKEKEESDGGADSVKSNTGTADTRTILLRHSGRLMPAAGYGTCCRKSAKGAAVEQSTLFYLQNGGRLIDTAMAYGNHAEIGSAVHRSQIARSELWITSKISPNLVRSYDETLAAVDSILKELQTEYLDLLLIHSPKLGKVQTIELWRGLIEAKRIGKVKAIGVSNFNQYEIQDLADATEEWPDANEIQFHPWSPVEWKRQHLEWCRQHDVAVIAYTSLGGQRFHRADEAKWPDVVQVIARRYGATESQVLLEWALRQEHVAVIPGSGSKQHILQNLQIPLSLTEMTDDEAAAIEAADPPYGWFDPDRGPAKMDGAAATVAWSGGA